VHHDVPQPEMATVRVQVSWRGELADRIVTVAAVAPQTAGGSPLARDDLDPEAEAGGGSLASGPLASGSDERVTSGIAEGEGV
jgi:hypothetical protein